MGGQDGIMGRKPIVEPKGTEIKTNKLPYSVTNKVASDVFVGYFTMPSGDRLYSVDWYWTNSASKRQTLNRGATQAFGWRE
jgi:hypothetical protein